jgi:hypothetical protein
MPPAFYVPSSRAEHRSSRRKKPGGCLSASEFLRARRLREAQGSPKGPVTRTASFGSFACPHKKMNSCQWKLVNPGLSPGVPTKFFSVKTPHRGVKCFLRNRQDSLFYPLEFPSPIRELKGIPVSVLTLVWRDSKSDF